jgi:uncharacterized protein
MVGATMLFDWDEDKRLGNIEKHGIDFADVIELFDIAEFVDVDQPLEQELRIKRIVKMTEGLYVTIIYTLRDLGDTTRIISSYPSGRAEIRTYNGRFGRR